VDQQNAKIKQLIKKKRKQLKQHKNKNCTLKKSLGTAVDADGTVDVKDLKAANQKLQKEANKKNYETHKQNNAKKEAFLHIKDQKKAADAFALLAKRRLDALKKTVVVRRVATEA